MSDTTGKDKKELDQMAKDVEKAVGKEKADLVAKTIAETKERLVKEQELADMKAQLEELTKAKEETEKRHQEDLEKLQGSFKEETDKLVKEFQDSRKSSVNTNNPFDNNADENDANADFMKQYNSDEKLQKEIDDNSREAFYRMLERGRF